MFGRELYERAMEQKTEADRAAAWIYAVRNVKPTIQD
jgi:hypothetical protein